jgi:hypothetical protein
MYINTVTPSGNKCPSERLKGMLADLRSNVSIIVESIKEIRQQAKSEGFEEHEIHSITKALFKQVFEPEPSKISFVLET